MISDIQQNQRYVANLRNTAYKISWGGWVYQKDAYHSREAPNNPHLLWGNSYLYNTNKLKHSHAPVHL